jgi:hypothetical protein
LHVACGPLRGFPAKENDPEAKHCTSQDRVQMDLPVGAGRSSTVRIQKKKRQAVRCHLVTVVAQLVVNLIARIFTPEGRAS